MLQKDKIMSLKKILGNTGRATVAICMVMFTELLSQFQAVVLLEE